MSFDASVPGQDDLPPGWATAPIAEVAEINPRTGFEAVDGETVVSFIPMAAVAEETGRIDLSAERKFSQISKGYTRFRDGDIIVAKITPCMENGKIAIARGLKNGLACGSTEFHVLRTPLGVSPDYIRYFLIQRAFRGEAERSMQGAVGHKRVPAAFLEKSRLPLAPTSEQARIVDKIDALFSQIEAGEQALARAQKLLERYRQSVLNAAVTGELTRDWREQHKEGKLESGEALLKRILQARREAWEQAELAKMHARGKPPSDDRWKQKYTEPEPPDTKDLPDLPEGWTWASLDQLVSGRPLSLQSGPFGSNLKHSEFRHEGILVIGIDNVLNGRFSIGSQNRISQQKYAELSKYSARPGDLLVTVMASLGRSCVVPRDLEPAIVTKHVYRITMEQEFVGPEYVNLTFQADSETRKLMLANAQGQTRPGLNSAILRVLPIPLPSTAEQNEIAARVLDHAPDVDGLLGALKTESRRCLAMRQSILTAAFSGKLVPQDPADEAASVLLERIREQRAAADGPKIRRPHRGLRASDRKTGAQLELLG